LTFLFIDVENYVRFSDRFNRWVIRSNASKIPQRI